MMKHLPGTTRILITCAVAALGACSPTVDTGNDDDNNDVTAEGEGEGSIAGEGEGEGSAAEGEGEGTAAEGEGEGAPIPNEDGVDNPTPITLPFAGTATFGPTDPGDCFSFQANAGDVITVKTSINGSTECSATSDTVVELYDANDITTTLDENDDANLLPATERCSFLEFKAEASGTFIACAVPFSSDDVFSGDLTITAAPPTLINTPGASCVPGALAAVCDENVPLNCLDPDDDGAFTCITVLADGAACTVGNSAQVCAAGLACGDLPGGGTATTCVQGTSLSCAAPTTLGTTEATGTFDGGDFFEGSCTFRGAEKVFKYRVTNQAADVAFAAGGDATAVFVRRDCLDEQTEAGCDGGTGATVTLRDVRGPTDLIVFVQGDAGGTFTLTATETARVIKQAGQDCNLDTDTCNPATPNLACLGGPSPGRGFTCTTPTLHTLDQACTSGSTDDICAAGLSCVNNVCKPDLGDRDSPLDVTLPVTNQAADITSADDVDCVRFVLAAPAEVIGSTAGACATPNTSDTFLEFFRTGSSFSSGSNDNDFSASSTTDCSRVARTIGVGSYEMCVSLPSFGASSETALGSTLSVTSTPVLASDADGSTLATPTSATIGTPANFDLAIGDADCFSFTVASTRTLKLETTGTGDPLLNLFRTAGASVEFIAFDDDSSASGNNSLITRSLDAGTYVACVDEFGANAALAGTLEITAQ